MDHTAEHLSLLMRTLAGHTGKSPSTVSRIVSGSGDTLNRLERKHAGAPVHRITTDRVARIKARLNEIWPDDLAWPSDVPRPEAPVKKRRIA